MQLENKVALVTGGSSGIGEATARLFAQEGAKVAILGSSADEVNRTVEEFEKAGYLVMPVVADVSKARQMEKAIKQVIERWDRLDVVFANAGVNGVWAPLEELAVEEWQETLDINLTGTFLTVKLAIISSARHPTARTERDAHPGNVGVGELVPPWRSHNPVEGPAVRAPHYERPGGSRRSWSER